MQFIIFTIKISSKVIQQTVSGSIQLAPTSVANKPAPSPAPPPPPAPTLPPSNQLTPVISKSMFF